MVTPSQTRLLALSTGHFAVGLHQFTALHEVTSQRRRVAKSLQSRIHVASVGDVLQSNQAALVVGVRVVAVRRIATVPIVHPLVGERLISAGVIRVIAHDRRSAAAVWCAGATADGGNQKHLGLAQVTPDSLRRQIHVHTVRLVGLEVQSAVVVVLFRAASVHAVALEAAPQILATDVAIWARMTLEISVFNTLFFGEMMLICLPVSSCIALMVIIATNYPDGDICNCCVTLLCFECERGFKRFRLPLAPTAEKYIFKMLLKLSVAKDIFFHKGIEAVILTTRLQF